MPNDDGPAGLSTSAIPTGLSALGTGTVRDQRVLVAEELDDLADRLLGGEAGGLAVPSTPHLACDRRDIDLVVARAQRDPGGWAFVPRRRANEGGPLPAPDRAQ